jgi:hypothetical protein
MSIAAGWCYYAAFAQSFLYGLRRRNVSLLGDRDGKDAIREQLMLRPAENASCLECSILPMFAF